MFCKLSSIKSTQSWCMGSFGRSRAHDGRVNRDEDARGAAREPRLAVFHGRTDGQEASRRAVVLLMQHLEAEATTQAQVAQERNRRNVPAMIGGKSPHM